MKSRIWVVFSAGTFCWAITSATHAQTPRLRPLGNPTLVQPRQIAGVQYEMDGTLRQTTPWMAYAGDGLRPGPCPVCFDSLELDGGFPGFPTDGAAGGGYDPDCGMGSARWFFEPTYCNLYAVNDLTVAPGQAGARADRAAFAWYVEPNRDLSQRCTVLLFTAEDFDETCAGPPSAGGFPGVIYEFLLPPDAGGYLFSHVNLGGTGLFHQMPLDGCGAVRFIIADHFDPRTGEIVPFSRRAQPMLWGTKNPDGTNPSRQGPIQWNDDAPADGVHTAPDECYDHSYGVCPDPLGLAVSFYACGGPMIQPGDANCDGTVDFFDLDPFLDCLQNQTAPCALSAVDLNHDGALDYFDLGPFIECVLAGGC